MSDTRQFGFSIPSEWKEALLTIADDTGMALDELTNAGPLYMADHSEVVQEWRQEQEQTTEPSPIALFRRHMVFDGTGKETCNQRRADSEEISCL